jgi:hypothetical protein
MYHGVDGVKKLVEKSKHTRGELISTMVVAIPPTGVESEVLRYVVLYQLSVKKFKIKSCYT